MNKQVFSIFAIPLFFLFLSCATSPATETDADGDAVVSTAGEEDPQSESESTAEADAGGASDAAETTGGTTAGAADASEHPGQAAGEGDNTAADEPMEPEPADSGALQLLGLIVSPETPRTGEEISIELDRTPFEKVVFDFGDGAAVEATHTYSTFGIKKVIVTATAGNQTASAELFFPVTGSATLHLSENTAEHDTDWKPIIEAQLEAEGDFDTIVVYENGREIFKISQPDEYKVPVPFAGERTFTAALFSGEFKVADIGAVTIIGLNTPPERPVYEGQEFIYHRPGEELSFTVTAVDPNKDPLVYEVKFAPVGAEFDETTGVFTWTPTTAQRGIYLLHFTAYDYPYGLASQFTQRGIMVQ